MESSENLITTTLLFSRNEKLCIEPTGQLEKTYKLGNTSIYSINLSRTVL